jgi:anti-sigma B factor antagonist
MTITKALNNGVLTVSLAGRLDTITSVQLSDEFDKIFSEEKVNLLLDFSELEYISSAGLRILLVARKKAAAIGVNLDIAGMNETVKEVFTVTGFAGLFNIM